MEVTAPRDRAVISTRASAQDTCRRAVPGVVGLGWVLVVWVWRLNRASLASVRAAWIRAPMSAGALNRRVNRPHWSWEMDSSAGALARSSVRPRPFHVAVGTL